MLSWVVSTRHMRLLQFTALTFEPLGSVAGRARVISFVVGPLQRASGVSLTKVCSRRERIAASALAAACSSSASLSGLGAGRHALSKGGSLYSRLILGVGVRDLTSGFKAFQRHALEKIVAGNVVSNGYSFQIETTYRALRLGLNVKEVPIVFVDRQVGASKMDRKIVLEAVTTVWKLRLRTLRHG